MPIAAIVYNPTKVADIEQVQTDCRRVCSANGWSDPVWIETTEQDPGVAMGHQAVERQVDLVIAMGGDGTVRAVASAVRGTGVPFGVIPRGTGNLLCRNLDIPLNDLEGALLVALTGDDRPIDVGVVTFDDQDPEPFLVISGVGVDADTMANTNENLKKLVGWLAYVESGQRALLGKGFDLRVTESENAPDHDAHEARSYMVCNCGILTGGVVLVPDAEPDDGLLNTLVISPKTAVGWGAVIMDVMTHHKADNPSLTTWTDHTSVAEFDPPVEGQIDGDAVGKVTRMTTAVEKLALIVRVPQGSIPAPEERRAADELSPHHRPPAETDVDTAWGRDNRREQEEQAEREAQAGLGRDAAGTTGEENRAAANHDRQNPRRGGATRA